MENKKKGRLRFFLLVCILLLLSACAKERKTEQGEAYVYCLNGEGTGLERVECEISEESAEAAAQAVLEFLAGPAESIEYMPAIPEGVEAKVQGVEHTIAYVDFNGAYLEQPPLREKLTRAAVVRSLIRQEGISGVWLTVEQEDLKNEAGGILGVLNEDDFVQSTGSSPSSYETAALALFFANEAGDRLVRQQMEVKYNSNISQEKLIVEKLMQGPQREGAFPTVNPAATLLSVTIKDGICYVNFDAEFLNSVYDVRPEITIYSIVNSLIEGTQAGMVQITVNGEKNVTYQDTMDLSQPIPRDLEWEETADEPAKQEK